MKRLTIIFTLVLCCGFAALSQSSLMKKANRAYDQMAYSNAADLYVQIADNGKADEMVQRRLAECYAKTGELKESKEWYEKLHSADKLTKDEMYNYSLALKANGEYGAAQVIMKEFNADYSDDLRAQIWASDTKVIEAILRMEPRAKISHLDINCEYADFGVSYYKDQVIFASARQPKIAVKRVHSWNNEPFLNLFTAELESDLVLRNPVPLKDDLNTKLHEGPACFNADGTVMYFTRNNITKKKLGSDENGVTHLNLYRATIQDGRWIEEKLSMNNDAYSCGHPALAADGKTLVFVSDMPGGTGGTDLYRCEIKDDGSIGEVENLGDEINTEGNEMFPSLHQSGLLLFASNGHPGLGGLDIFASRYVDGTWIYPMNYGKPLNSAFDDFSLVLDKNQHFGFMASNRYGGAGSDDIYSVELIKPASDMYVLSGMVTDEKGLPLADALINLLTPNGVSMGEVTTDENGKYSYAVQPETLYNLKGQKLNYIGQTKAANTYTLNEENRNLTLNLVLSSDAGISITGVVYDRYTNEILPNAKITIYNNLKSKKYGEFLTDESGKIDQPITGLTKGEFYHYSVIIEKDGFIEESFDLADIVGTSNILFRGDLLRPMNLLELEEIDLSRFLAKDLVGIDLGKLISINPIYFDLDKANIRTDASEELDKIIFIMKKYPSMVIELGSHTDCRGSAAYNAALSDRRAKASAQYIISKGIDKSRITGKGYGETELVTGCPCEGNHKSECSEEDHQLNRRTEFIIVKL